MNNHSTRFARLGALVLATAVIIAGCKGSTPAPQVTQAASTPTPTTVATAKATASPVVTAPAATEASTAPSATPAAVASATPVAPPTAAPSDTPVASAAPSSVAGACTGTADHQAFFADAAAKLPFDVYCAVLPAGWWLQSADYQQSDGGAVNVVYKNTPGATVSLHEGNFCADPSTCWVIVSTVGSASFGPVAGSLVVASATPVYGVYVGPHTTHSYVIIGSGLTQAKFVAIAAALVKVPKA